MPREGFEAKAMEMREGMVSRYADIEGMPTLERTWRAGLMVDVSEDIKKEREVIIDPYKGVELRFLADVLPEYISPDAKGIILPAYNARYSHPSGERAVIGTPEGIRFAVRPQVNRDRFRDGFEGFIKKNLDDYRYQMGHEYYIDPITHEHDLGEFTPHSAISLRPEQIQDLAATGLGERKPSMETVMNSLEQIGKSLALQVKYLELSGDSHDEAYAAWHLITETIARLRAESVSA